MSFLFGGNESPQPAPVPASPSAPDNEAAQKARNDATDAAVVESKSRGRQQTVSAGALIAEDEQYGRGLLSQKRRAASRTLVGD